MKRELAVLQAGRGLAALAVVFKHLNSAIFARFWSEEIWIGFRGGASGVDFFFVLSGFLMAWIHGGQSGDREAKRFLCKRAWRIYPAYWAAVLPLMAFLMAVPSLARGRELDPGHMIASFFLLPTPEHPVLAVAWTLQHEVVFYALFAFAVWRPRTGAVVMTGWLIAAALSGFLYFDFPLSTLLSHYHLLFGLGMAAAWWTRRGGPPQPALMAALGAAGFLAAWVALCIMERTAGMTWAFGLSASVALAGFVRLEQLGRINISGGLKTLGDASYALYLVHAPAMTLLAMILLRLPIELPRLVAAPIFLGVAISSGVLFHVIVERPFLKLARRWTPAASPGVVK